MILLWKVYPVRIVLCVHRLSDYLETTHKGGRIKHGNIGQVCEPASACGLPGAFLHIAILCSGIV